MGALWRLFDPPTASYKGSAPSGDTLLPHDDPQPLPASSYYAQCNVESAVPKAWITLIGYLKSKLNVLAPILPNWHMT